MSWVREQQEQLGDAEKLYNWAPVGTLVRIEGVAPGTPTYEERLAELEQE